MGVVYRRGAEKEIRRGERGALHWEGAEEVGTRLLSGSLALGGPRRLAATGWLRAGAGMGVRSCGSGYGLCSRPRCGDNAAHPGRGRPPPQRELMGAWSVAPCPAQCSPRPAVLAVIIIISLFPFCFVRAAID